MESPHRPFLMVATAVLGLALPADAAWPWPTVRNHAPQQLQSPVQEQRPVYYPRPARATGDGSLDETDRLLREFLDLHTAMRYERSAAAARRLIELRPDLALAHYNLACALGRLHRVDESLCALEAAVDRGFRDLPHLAIDPDLDTVRRTDRYRDLLRRLRDLNALETARRSAWPTVVADLGRRTPALLARCGADAATIAFLDEGRVVWIESFGEGVRSSGRVGPDDPVEVSSCVRLIALAAGPEARDADAAGFARLCRRRVLDPLGMHRTTLEVSRELGRVLPAETDVVAYSTARDLARLVSALCADGVASGDATGLDTFLASGTAAAGLQVTHANPDTAAVVRWLPEPGRGIVVIAAGEGRIEAARSIARLGLP